MREPKPSELEKQRAKAQEGTSRCPVWARSRRLSFLYRISPFKGLGARALDRNKPESPPPRFQLARPVLGLQAECLIRNKANPLLPMLETLGRWTGGEAIQQCPNHVGLYMDFCCCLAICSMLGLAERRFSRGQAGGQRATSKVLAHDGGPTI